MHKATRSFLPKATAIVAFGLITSLGSYKAAAVDVYTDPVGFITLNVTAGPIKYSFWGIGMTQIPTNVGLVGIVSGTQLTLSNQTLTAGAFNRLIGTGPTTNATHFIEITSGTNAGLIDDIVSNDTAAVFTASDDSALIAAGQTYKIYPHWTLGNLFGTNNTAGFTPGTSDANADNVQVWNPDTQGYATYYFKTNAGGGGTGWRALGTPTIVRANTQLYIDEGIVVTRRPATATNTLVVGAVKLGKTINPAVAGPNKYTHIGNVYPSTFTLDASGLYTTNSATGVAPGTSDANADNVQIWSTAAQGYATYYFKTNAGGGGTGWRRLGAPTVPAGTTNIVLGTSVVITRRSGTGFNWVVPQPFAQ